MHSAGRQARKQSGSWRSPRSRRVAGLVRDYLAKQVATPTAAQPIVRSLVISRDAEGRMLGVDVRRHDRVGESRRRSAGPRSRTGNGPARSGGGVGPTFEGQRYLAACAPPPHSCIAGEAAIPYPCGVPTRTFCPFAFVKWIRD